jgi:hypothetical protein
VECREGSGRPVSRPPSRTAPRFDASTQRRSMQCPDGSTARRTAPRLPYFLRGPAEGT